MRRVIKLGFARCWSAFNREAFIDHYLDGLEQDFEFVQSDDPDYVIFMPYPGPMPPGRYVRIFFGSEYVRPDMQTCDWAFSYFSEDAVRHPRHMHAIWDSDSRLIKGDLKFETIKEQKTRFCSFLYTNRVGFREEFCRRLSRYKKVDCPGGSLNNMPSIDSDGSKSWMDCKIEFLRSCKFTIAFENTSQPGYTTEKLWQPMLVNSIPIYWGNPMVGEAYNSKSFISYYDFEGSPRFRIPSIHYLFRNPDSDSGRWSLGNRVLKRINRLTESVNMRMWRIRGFRKLIDRVIEIDQNDELYERMLRESWCHGNKPPDRGPMIERWREIFNTPLEKLGRGQ